MVFSCGDVLVQKVRLLEDDRFIYQNVLMAYQSCTQTNDTQLQGVLRSPSCECVRMAALSEHRLLERRWRPCASRTRSCHAETRRQR
jgi:hypothetical protein